MLDHMLFENKGWYQPFWFKCNGNNNWSFVWVWKYNPAKNQMDIVWTPDHNEIVKLAGKTLLQATPPKNYKAGQNSSSITNADFCKIISCPTHPEYAGDYVMLDDLKLTSVSGGVLALYRLYSKLYSLFRKAVSL